MIHLAIPSMSVRGGGRPYTTPGMGDRVHSCLLGYQYGRKCGEPVTLHLTADKVSGGDGRKLEAWREALALFPPGSVKLKVHSVHGISNADWVEYLRLQGIAATCYYYADTYGMHPAEERFPLDISAYLRASPLLEKPPRHQDLPAHYVTVQWAGSGQAHDVRRIPDDRAARIRAACQETWPTVDVARYTTLADLAAAVAHAEFHAGIDSGPMHVASLYLPYERLHVYTGNGSRSHHVRRWLANGARENVLG